MVAPGFHAMRAGLVAHGLIDAEYRLTPAGNAHVDALLVKLRAEAPSAPAAPRVRWRSGRSL